VIDHRFQFRIKFTFPQVLFFLFFPEILNILKILNALIVSNFRLLKIDMYMEERWAYEVISSKTLFLNFYQPIFFL